MKIAPWIVGFIGASQSVSFALCVGFAGSCYAQSNQSLEQALAQEIELERLKQNRVPPVNQGAARAGAVLGGLPQSREDAYMRGVIQGQLERQRDEASAAAEKENRRIRAEQRWRDTLVTQWQAVGLPLDEALALASSYKLDVAQQNAVGERVERLGSAVGWKAAKAAYEKKNYQTANELMVAFSHVFQEEQKQTTVRNP